MDDFILEEKIKRTLEHRAGQMKEEPLAAQRIRTNVHQRIEEETGMKKKNWKKVALAAAAICVLGSMSVMALGKAVSATSHSNRNEAVHSFEEAVALNEGMNQKIKFADQLSNGYHFVEAVPETYEERDKDDNIVNQGDSLSVTYGKKGMADVYLSAEVSSLGTETSAAQTLVGKDGTEFGFSTLRNKFVPPDYQITEEEKKLQEAGLLNVGYGSDKIEETVSQSVTWNQDGLSYMLFSFENTMSGEEMLQMAEEISKSK